MTKPSKTPKKPVDDVGKIGEDFVETVCQLPIGKDFLFRGQKYRDGNNELELTDLLILVGEVAIFIEVKTAFHDNKTGWYEKAWADWASERTRKALAQLERGLNAIKNGLVKMVSNERQGSVEVHADAIRELHAIAIVDHPPLGKWGTTARVRADGREVDVMTTTHEELLDVLTELSTPGDLLAYLKARAMFFKANRMLGIRELDLLACYKEDPDAFVATLTAGTELILEDGLWEQFASLDLRRKRAEFDKHSWLVDGILDILHEGRVAQLEHIERLRADAGNAAGGGDYIAIASELAMINRLDRRLIGEALLDKSKKCIDQKRDRWFGSPSREGRPPIVFLVSTDTREARTKWLTSLAWGLKLRKGARRAIGIATEPVNGNLGFSVDAISLTSDPEWDIEKIPKDLQETLKGQFPRETHVRATEFQGPDTE